ncbi:ATP-dependent nuclease [Pantoea ananatis]|uniref:ATP-dependent nuclease n=1 Tax=Pantoea ananas TaxID=553 RepID=UPI0013756E20|nr:AAA family ATPase [Pantoea ananatis]NCU09734.1 AAA family ATPase [Pantoea ananatis]
MINEIDFVSFKKLKNIKISFDENLNVISGTNGACKTTLLQLISNAFQMPTARSNIYNNNKCLRIIREINKIANPKMEAIVRDSKKYSDPADGIKGRLYSVIYSNANVLDFRKHNSKDENLAHRYALKPMYPRDKPKQSLPHRPVIYLGLSRLFPIGEIKDSDIELQKSNLPNEYNEMISEIYKEFLGFKINNIGSNSISDFKSGPEFETDNPEIDSNTISSGEDNLFIILKALVSLKFYYQSLEESVNHKESILLIDEFDATLHPYLQIKLLDKMNEYAKEFKIQIFLTTHSLSLLKYASNKKIKITYLINNHSDIINLEEPNYIKIKMFLQNKSRDDTYIDNKIPVFTEDPEARYLFDEIFNFWISKKPELAAIRNCFHLIDCSIGANNLKTIFDDPFLMETSLKSICIFDGDHQGDIRKSIISLPGKKSPEEFILDHCEKILNEGDENFWKNPDIYNQGFTRDYYLTEIQPFIYAIRNEYAHMIDNEESTHGYKRKKYKKLFNEHRNYFTMVTINWIKRSENQNELEFFYNGLKQLFYKVVVQNNISKVKWTLDFKDIPN